MDIEKKAMLSRVEKLDFTIDSINKQFKGKVFDTVTLLDAFHDYFGGVLDIEELEAHIEFNLLGLYSIERFKSGTQLRLIKLS
tara:strand:+ start:3073 stop:3321 length:249 start_codon:yes stop_codon:yes gene_type:complete